MAGSRGSAHVRTLSLSALLFSGMVSLSGSTCGKMTAEVSAPFLSGPEERNEIV